MTFFVQKRPKRYLLVPNLMKRILVVLKGVREDRSYVYIK